MYTVINDVFFNPIALTYVRFFLKKIIFLGLSPGFLQKYLGCTQCTVERGLVLDFLLSHDEDTDGL